MIIYFVHVLGTNVTYTNDSAFNQRCYCNDLTSPILLMLENAIKGFVLHAGDVRIFSELRCNWCRKY